MKKLFFVLSVLLLSFSLFASGLYTTGNLLALMEENNTEVKKARESVQKAYLDIQDAKGSYCPSVDLTLSGSYIANPMEAIRINPSDYVNMPGVVSSDYITLYKGQESTYYQFKVELIQPLYTSGKLSNAVKLANEAYEARILDLQRTIEDNSVKVKAQCAALHYLNELYAVVDETSSLSERLVELSLSAFENGMMIESEYKTIVAKARATDSAKAQILSQIIALEANIGSLCGLEDFSSSSLVFNEEELEALYEEIDSYSYGELKDLSVSERRTVLRLLKKMEEISLAARNFASAKISWKPDVALVVDFDYTGSRFPLIEKDWYRQDDWSGTVTVAIKTTLFDAGASSRDLSRAVSDMAEAEIDSSQARSQILTTLAENYGTYISSASDADYQNSLYESYQSTLTNKKTLMDSGYGSESDYIQSQIDLSSCKADLIRANMNRAVAAYTISYLCDLTGAEN